MTITTTNINTGGARVTVGGTARAANVDGYITGTTGGTDIGCTTGGVKISYSFETKDIFCDQSLAAVETSVVSETASVEFEMLETQAANLKYALQQQINATGTGKNYLGVGGVVTLTTIPLMIEVADNDNAYDTTWTFFKCVNKSMSINFERDNPTTVACNFSVYADTSHASGHQLFDVVEETA